LKQLGTSAKCSFVNDEGVQKMLKALFLSAATIFATTALAAQDGKYICDAPSGQDYSYFYVTVDGKNVDIGSVDYWGPGNDVDYGVQTALVSDQNGESIYQQVGGGLPVDQTQDYDMATADVSDSANDVSLTLTLDGQQASAACNLCEADSNLTACQSGQ
jgi:hypothetical protein